MTRFLLISFEIKFNSIKEILQRIIFEKDYDRRIHRLINIHNNLLFIF